MMYFSMNETFLPRRLGSRLANSLVGDNRLGEDYIGQRPAYPLANVLHAVAHTPGQRRRHRSVLDVLGHFLCWTCAGANADYYLEAILCMNRFDTLHEWFISNGVKRK